MIREVNFDGLVGPSHNYGGLSFGNIASINNKSAKSSPRKAALQGLEKMKYLMDRGILQGVLPPQERPYLGAFRKLGFEGSDQSILKKVAKEDFLLFSHCTSASSMWAANAAIVSPSIDTHDKKVHITPANLISNFHRSLESEFTTKVLRKIFRNKSFFTVHDPLPSHTTFSDEGAANFCRITKEHGKKGLEVFVYGRNGKQDDLLTYPARQTSEANQVHGRRHQLSPNHFIDIKQNPSVINQGVFHNDVISVANENVFLFHELAFESKKALKYLQLRAEAVTGGDVYFLKVTNKDLTVKEAVQTYLFNSQIISLSKSKMLLLAPKECEKSPMAQKVIRKIIDADNPIQEVQYLDLRESMRNGGGPACLRLRVVLSPKELAALSGKVILTNTLYRQLVSWVNEFYLDELLPKDLVDYKLYCKNKFALEELSKILRLPGIYDLLDSK